MRFNFAQTARTLCRTTCCLAAALAISGCDLVSALEDAAKDQIAGATENETCTDMCDQYTTCSEGTPATCESTCNGALIAAKTQEDECESAMEALFSCVGSLECSNLAAYNNATSGSTEELPCAAQTTAQQDACPQASSLNVQF